MGRIAQFTHWIDLAIISCLGILGVVILSTTGKLWISQGLYLIVSLVLALGVSFFDAALLLVFAPFGYILAILFLLASFAEPAIRGATRWVFIGGAQLQPSELVKPFLLLAFSFFLVKYPPTKIRNMLFHGALFFVPFLIVFKQPDFGTSLIYFLAWLSMMVAAGFPVRILLAMSLVSFLSLPVFWKSLHGYQQNRIITFLNPSIDPGGAGYNALQAMIAIGSGQFAGRGLGRGTQSHLRFLPESHTDFIFATLVEEFGFVGGFVVLFGMAVLLWRIIGPMFRQNQEKLVFIYGTGLFMLILMEITINTGMNMGLVPITGITLPLISYGGSSLLSTGVSFGILWSLVKEGKSMVE